MTTSHRPDDRRFATWDGITLMYDSLTFEQAEHVSQEGRPVYELVEVSRDTFSGQPMTVEHLNWLVNSLAGCEERNRGLRLASQNLLRVITEGVAGEHFHRAVEGMTTELEDLTAPCDIPERLPDLLRELAHILDPAISEEGRAAIYELRNKRVADLRDEFNRGHFGKYTPSLGTVSHGTLRPQDLVPAFLDELMRFDRLADVEFTTEHPGLYDELGNLLDDDDECWNSEEATEAVQWLAESLDEEAPDFMRFGTHDGDGSDFGWWPDWGAVEAGVEEKSIADVGDSLPSYVQHTSDHGNVSIYSVQLKPVLEVV